MGIKQLFTYLVPFVKPYKWLIVGTLILTLIGSFAAQVNAWVLRYTVDGINEIVENGGSFADGKKILLFISAILIGKEIVNIFIQFGQKYFGEKLRILVSKDLAQMIIEKVLTYKLAFFSNEDNSKGKLQTRIDRGIESLTRLIQNFFIDIVPLFANSIVALVVMFNANVYVGMVGLCVIPIYFYISQIQANKLKGARRNIKNYRENKSQGIINIIESIPVIKSFVREDIESQKQLDLQDKLTYTQLSTRTTMFLFSGIKNFVEQFGVVIIIILTAYLVLDRYTGMTIGAIMFHILLFNNITAPIKQLQRIYDDMNDILIYSEAFFEIANADDQVEQSGKYTTDKPAKGHFLLNKVNFQYPNGTQALHDINIEIEPNKITALVGLSGAGKSTIINMLTRFYEPTSGEVLLDGINLNDYDTSYLRNNIGLVLQKNHIFSGTIQENVLYGNPNAPLEEIIEACKKAHIHEQIMELPHQYETSALMLSGGQQQRIAIARVFLKNPPIIFLDEPTASLDAIATEQIKNSIDAIKKDRTVIIISHSISQIIDADVIYVMKQGEVVEHGTHEELYDDGGTYQEIFEAMARSLNLDKITKTFDH